MIFGEIPVRDAVGAILAHSQTIEIDGVSRKLPKGTVLTAEYTGGLEAGGTAAVMAARLELDDVSENEAASRLAVALAGGNVHTSAAFTGRCNLVAKCAGLVLIDASMIDAVNDIDESITLATLNRFDDVGEGQMLATVKIIPFAAPRDAVERAVEVINSAASISVAAYGRRNVGLLATCLPGQKKSLWDKTCRVMSARCEKSGSRVAASRQVGHETAAVADGLTGLKADGADILVAFSASAIVDRGDVLPKGLLKAGGAIHHFGMPVDPGNLLLIGDIGGTPVIGAPSCARTPKLNGFDWIFDRLVAGLDVSPNDIVKMGVGGLLKEIPSRPQPRAGRGLHSARHAPRIAVVLLAAGRSSRMGLANKLTTELRGRPMVAWATEAAQKSSASDMIVVTGHNAGELRDALRKWACGQVPRFVHNPDYARGLSTSLATGLGGLGDNIDGALIVLGDMPGITAGDLDRLIAAFDPEEGRAIIVPSVGGQRGNPVLWAAEFFPELMALHGDVGARHLIGAYSEVVFEVELGARVLADIDTPEALAAAQAVSNV